NSCKVALRCRVDAGSPVWRGKRLMRGLVRGHGRWSGLGGSIRGRIPRSGAHAMKTPAGAGAGAIVLLVALLLVAPAIAAPPAASRSGLAGATARPISVAAGISSAGVSPTATKSRTPRLTVAAATPAAEHKPAEFLVGFDKEDITPTNLPFSYLGGQGYERVGTTVVSPL